MAIDTSLSGWLDELQHAEASIKPYLESMIEDKKAYMGRAFRTGEGRMAPENSRVVRADARAVADGQPCRALDLDARW
jgi:hypothetical protein